MNQTPHTPDSIDTTVPHSARVWNYWLGGKDNYPIDREVGEQVRSLYPRIATDARCGRAFLARTITHLARDQGVHQFLDIGTGLPTQQNTHEIAQACAPRARVVYVDNDPMVLAHARALLVGTEEGATEFIDADLREPDKVLDRARETLDLTRPIGLSVIGTLGHIPSHSDALKISRAYVDALPSGSFLVLGDGVFPDEPEAVEALNRWNEAATLAYRAHSTADMESYFAGLDLLEPGLVPVTAWRPDDLDVGVAPETDMYGAVGRKP